MNTNFSLSTLRARRAAILEETRLYAILDTGYVPPTRLVEIGSALVEGGVRVFQLRAKGLDRETIRSTAGLLLSALRPRGAILLLNDHPALAAEIDADGAHVGQDDESVAEARSLLGPDAILGKSTHSISQAREAQNEDIDYTGFGPLFATPTKPDYIPVGLNDIQEAHELARVPVFCIGGIKRHNLPMVLKAGAKRVVIVSGLLQTADPRAEAEACLKILRGET